MLQIPRTWTDYYQNDILLAFEPDIRRLQQTVPTRMREKQEKESQQQVLKRKRKKTQAERREQKRLRKEGAAEEGLQEGQESEGGAAAEEELQESEDEVEGEDAASVPLAIAAKKIQSIVGQVKKVVRSATFTLTWRGHRRRIAASLWTTISLPTRWRLLPLTCSPTLLRRYPHHFPRCRRRKVQSMSMAKQVGLYWNA